jgi:serine/threonine protein kinase
MLPRFRSAAPQLVEGVRVLHAAGHLHRDIKPSNIKVDGTGRVVLLDFDLMTPLRRSLPMDFASAELAGTLAYMAPEQLMGITVGPAADRYSVGVVFYETLSGSCPSASTRCSRGTTSSFLSRTACRPLPAG